MRIRAPLWLADAFIRCPAAPVALAMMLGTGLARDVLPVRPWVAFGASTACLLFARVIGHRGRIATLFLLLAAMFASITATQIALFRFASDDLGLYAGAEARLARLRLYLPHEPRLRSVAFGSRLPFPPKQTTLAEVREVLTRDGWRRAGGSVLLQVHQVVEGLAAGQTIEVLARLERPGVAMNPGQFDWQRYYRDQGVLGSVQVRRADALTILARGPPPFLTRWREACRDWLERGYPSDRALDHALMAALVLGDYDPELRDVKEDFRTTGTSHHLAISGMHVAIVGGLVFLFFRLAGAMPRTCWIGSMVLVGTYACAAMPSPPVLRSVILFGAAGGAFLVGRLSAGVHLLAFTVAVMIAVHPPDLFNAGFQLSFGTVLGLLILSEPLAARWAGQDHILTRDEVDRLPARARLIRWFDKWHLHAWSAGIVAWLMSMPLVALHFTRLNPWQVIASIALAPAVTAALVIGVMKIMLSALCPAIASPLATIAATSTKAMRETVGWLATWPFADVPLAAPPIWIVVACWVSLALWAAGDWRIASIRYAVTGLLVLSFSHLVLGPYLFGASRTLSAGQMRVTLMAVGAGQCALVEQAGGRTVLLDCGSASLTDLTTNVVVAVLRDRGITRIDSIFISHANADHYSGVAEIAAAYDVREVVVGHNFARWARQSPSGEELLAALAAMQKPPRVARAGDDIPLGRDASIEVLWPESDSARLEANDGSLVLRLRKGDRSLLFTGDIQSAGIAGLLRRGVEACDLLIAPHHGSSEEITPRLLVATDPRWIVSSNDRSLTAKQLDLARMASGRQLMRTSDHGAITVLIERDGAMYVEGFVKPRGE